MSKEKNKVEKVDFDQYADVYEKTLEEDLKFFGEENSYFAEYKIKIIKDTSRINPVNILEYGCGIGRNLKFLESYYPNTNIYATDLSEESMRVAEKLHPKVNFLKIDSLNSRLDIKFDLILCANVFHHIHPKYRKETIQNLSDVLNDKGVLYIFEHNPYNPLTQKVVKDCIWDADAILLNAKESIELISYGGLKLSEKNYTIFFPAFLKSLRFLEKYMKFIPIGGQYYIKALK